MTRITYHCPNCGDPDGEDAFHSISVDGLYHWNPRTQRWEGEGPGVLNLFCSECGDIGGAFRHEVELPDLSPLEQLENALVIWNDHVGQMNRAWERVRAAEAALAKGGAE